jgi:hypothetical protein
MLFVLYSLAGAVNILEVHTHHGLLGGILYGIVLAVASYWVLFSRHPPVARKLFRSLALWLTVLAVLGLIDARHNHKAEAGGSPMTTSLALEYPARAFLHGHEMYSVTANGAPISPGPGWILLWSPITVPGWTGLLCAIALAVVVVLLYRRSAIAAGCFALLMLVQPLFLSQMANGQDLFAIAFALVALALLLERADTDWKITALGVLGGVVATARVPIVAFVALIGVGLWKRDRRAGVRFLVVSLAVATAFHAEGAYFAHLASHFYQPMHVLGRASAAGGISHVKGAALLVAGTLFALWRIRGNAVSWLLWTFATMSLLFTPEGVGEYFTVHRWDWEGANYISFPIPLLLAALVLMSAKSYDARRKSAETISHPGESGALVSQLP